MALIQDSASAELIGVVLTAELPDPEQQTLSLTALVASATESTLRVDELELRVDELEREVRLYERWEAAIAGRRSASLLVDSHGQVIAARGAGHVPERIDLSADPGRLVQMPDGRTFEVEWLEGNGAILWLRRRRALLAPRLHLRLLGNSADARLGSARPERGLRSLELLAVLAMHREGLTAEQLALALYGERGKTVTIRGQVHRVRAHLGQRALRTAPYRLARSFDADSLEVARLRGRGASGRGAACVPRAAAACLRRAGDRGGSRLAGRVATAEHPDHGRPRPAGALACSPLRRRRSGGGADALRGASGRGSPPRCGGRNRGGGRAADVDGRAHVECNSSATPCRVASTHTHKQREKPDGDHR